MPHNLYLHSGVVQTRRFGNTVEDKREAIKLATLDSTIALMFALLINASILILAAATFNKAGKTDVAELDQAHAFLAPLLGSGPLSTAPSSAARPPPSDSGPATSIASSPSCRTSLR